MQIKTEHAYSVKLDGIGDVFLVHSNSKYYKIQIRHGKVIASYPHWGTQQAALDFVATKKNWIVKHLEKHQSKKMKYIDDINGFSTFYRSLEFATHEHNDIRCRVTKDKITVIYPAHIPLQNEQIQKYLQNVIINIWRSEAKYYLPKRLYELATEHQFSFGNVTIRKAGNRWGSCSSKNNISLNLFLIQLPTHLIDMVLLHELCHTKIKNHSLHFKALLKQVCPNVSNLEKELRKYPVNPFV